MRSPLVSLLLIALLVPSIACWWDETANRAKANAAFAAVSNTAGVFKRVSRAGQPIFRHVSGGDWGMQRVGTRDGTAIYKPSDFGNAVNGLAKVLRWGSIAMDVVNVAEAAGKDLLERRIANTVHATFRAYGGYAGATVGASIGTRMLSHIPGVGTIVGGVVGGFIGTYAGTIAGQGIAIIFVGS